MIYDTPFILQILSFLFFLYYLSMRVHLCARTYAHCLHVYNKVKYQEKYDKYRKSVKILLISKLFLGNIWWFRKMFVLLHSLLRNTISQGDKERVLWKILHKQTSSTRSGFGLHLIIYIGSMKRLGKRNEPSSNWQVRFTKLQ